MLFAPMFLNFLTLISNLTILLFAHSLYLYLQIGDEFPQYIEKFMQVCMTPAPSISQQPSDVPSFQPSISTEPSTEPSNQPSISHEPTVSSEPTASPSANPTTTFPPSAFPTVSPAPSNQPSDPPTISKKPTPPPTVSPPTHIFVSPLYILRYFTPPLANVRFCVV